MPTVLIVGGTEEGLVARCMAPRGKALLPALAKVLKCSVEEAAESVAAARHNVRQEEARRRRRERRQRMTEWLGRHWPGVGPHV